MVGASEIGYDADIIFERVIGILFLEGVVEWQGQKRARLLAAKT